jgi:DNA polymerase-3 subunit gamma/tau
MRWEEKYRPERFSEVHGQEDAVRLLSGFVLRRISDRHVLFHGAIGSGKTSFARMLGKALNCQSVGDDGSPCQSCSPWLNPQYYFFEYNVAGAAGDMQKVRAWVTARNRSPAEAEVRVLFLDEAHALNVAAQDSILKEIENAAPSVLFCFATSEPEELKPALRSRLMDIRIRALGPRQAFSVLENVARQEGIAYDDNALHLLAAVKPPHARDLIIALQHLASLGRRVDTDLVKRVFDVTAGDYLERYFLALIEGDFQAKAEALVEWRRRFY